MGNLTAEQARQLQPRRACCSSCMLHCLQYRQPGQRFFSGNALCSLPCAWLQLDSTRPAVQWQRLCSYLLLLALGQQPEFSLCCGPAAAGLLLYQGTVQGINRVLLPAKAASNASETAMAGTNTNTSETAMAGTNSTSTTSPGRRLLGPAAEAASMASGRQLLRYGSNRAAGYGGGNSDSGCDPTLDNGCGVPGSQNSMMWQSLQDSSEAMSSGSAVDAGDEF